MPYVVAPFARTYGPQMPVQMPQPIPVRPVKQCGCYQDSAPGVVFSNPPWHTLGCPPRHHYGCRDVAPTHGLGEITVPTWAWIGLGVVGVGVILATW